MTILKSTSIPRPGTVSQVGRPISRRGFVGRALASLVGVAGFSVLGARYATPAEAATLQVLPSQSVICSSGSSCHYGGSLPGIGCCSGSNFARDKWYVKRNNTSSPRSCSGTYGGPCCGSPKQCYGGPAWWMSPYYTKECCAVS